MVHLYAWPPDGTDSIRLRAHAYYDDTELRVSFGGVLLEAANLGTSPGEYVFPLPEAAGPGQRRCPLQRSRSQLTPACLGYEEPFGPL